MKPGPKKKPTALRILEGNPSKRPLNDMEPTCHLPPVKPSFVEMDEVASREWDRAIAAMPPNFYTALDVAVLAMYASAWSMIDMAQRDIDQHGAVMLLPKGPAPNPAIKGWKAAVDTLFKCCDRLGLHPGARVALKIPERNPTPSNFAGLIGRKN